MAQILPTDESEPMNSIVFPDKQPPTALVPPPVRKRGTIHVEGLLEEDVQSMFRLTVIMVAIMSGGLNLGYGISYLTLSVDTLFAVIDLQGSKTEELGLFGAILPIGSLVGSVMAYFLMKYTTRKQALLITDLFGMASILMIIPIREVVLTFRFFFGVSNGIGCIIQPLFVKELCPDQYYAQYSNLAGFAVGTGLLIGNLFGLGFLNSNLRGVDSQWWKVVFAMPALLCFIRQIFLNFIVPVDSPIQLLELNREDEAKAILAYMYEESSVNQALIKGKLRVEHNKTQREGLLSIFALKHRQTVLIGVLLMFTYTWSGIPAVFTYSAQFFQDIADNDLGLITGYTVILGFAQQCPAYISKWLFGNYGKRPILIVGLIILIIELVIITILSYFNTPVTNVLLFITMCLAGFMYAATLSPIAWQTIPELNNSEGTFVGISSFWVWQLMLLYIFPFMVDGIGIGGSFIVFTIITILCTIYFYKILKETKGLNHNQIYQLYEKHLK